MSRKQTRRAINLPNATYLRIRAAVERGKATKKAELASGSAIVERTINMSIDKIERDRAATGASP